jgi:hypothetical protein
MDEMSCVLHRRERCVGRGYEIEARKFSRKICGDAELKFYARVVSVTDGGCRYESQNAVGISGLVGRADIGVWMRWRGNGNAAATGDQRRRIAEFG